MAKENKNFVIELLDRFEKEFIKHQGKHKLIVEGITIETPIKAGITKVLHITGDMEFEVKNKKKK